MRKILILLAICGTINAQHDETIRGGYAEIILSDTLYLSGYFDAVRIESPHVISVATKLNELSTSLYPDYPAFSTPVEKGDIYNYSGELIQVVQSHNITIYDPHDVPALFSFYREGTGINWIENEVVAVGDVRVYEGLEYECIQSHMTLSAWIPPSTPTLWQVVQAGCPDWVQPQGAHDAYNIGDCVTFNGHTYESKINANVFSPSVYPAGWTLIE
jgi:hypothetical protein